MLQDVLSLKPPNEIIDEAARFFTQRRIKVIARSKNSLRFALSAAHAAEAGQVKAVRDATGQTRVSVETGGLSVWHIAESYLRDLRKQARSGARARRRRRAAGTTRLTGVITRLARQRPRHGATPTAAAAGTAARCPPAHSRARPGRAAGAGPRRGARRPRCTATTGRGGR